MTSTLAPVQSVEHGQVFTRRWVVDLILDLAGYTPERDLAALRAVEPAAGDGAFAMPMLDRLTSSLRANGRDLTEAGDAIRAYELQAVHTDSLRAKMAAFLVADGWPADEVAAFVEASVVTADYLLATHAVGKVDVVVGNPPYIRLEDLGPDRLARYQSVSPAMMGRADIFVGFYDVSLDSLAPGGVCAFICADRWMRNSYGKALRGKVVRGFAVDAVVTMHDAPAFEEEVSAYPAVTVLRRGAQAQTIVATGTERFGRAAARRLIEWLADPSEPLEAEGLSAAVLPSWFETDGLWPEASAVRIAWLERIAETLPTIEGSGARIRIGVATGADAAYLVGPSGLPDIEPDRLLPMSMGDDITSGTFVWGGRYLVSPWDSDGLVSLDEYPKMAAYLSGHPRVAARSIARRSGPAWYRTIDRVFSEVTAKPKLLMEDMKARAHPVLEEGGHYPHHNLYYITSDTWDLRVLGGLMLSEVVEAQVAAYCVKMRGGTLRFQAQYLRQVRIPAPAQIPAPVARRLAEAFNARDRDAATAAALEAFGLDALPK